MTATTADLNVELAASLMVEESAGRLLIHAANAARRYLGRNLAMDQVLLELDLRDGDLTAARLVAAHRAAAEAYATARIELADLQQHGTLPTTRR